MNSLIIKYLIVALISFTVDISVLYLSVSYVGFHYMLAAAIAFSMGLIVNYLLSINWVFQDRTYDSKKIEFILFTSIGLIGLVLNEIVMWVLTEKFILFYMYSKFISAGIVFMWNYLLRKKLLFTIKVVNV